jgi:imidazolonepropionase-like amidohydrolase
MRMKWRIMLLLCASLTLSAAGFARDGKPASPAAKRVVVHAGRLLDVTTGSVLTDQAIVIEDDLIVSVGPAQEVKLVPGQTIDLTHATVLPGLIDAHTHLTLDDFSEHSALSTSLPREALIGAKNARITLEAGITTVRDVGANGYTDIALRDAVSAGDLPGPRIVASGPPLGITGGHCDNNILPYEYHDVAGGVADGVENVQHKVREVIKYGADVVKFCATGGVMSKGDDPNAAQYTLEEMKALVADAHRLGRKVAAHAHGLQGIKWAVEAGVDSIEHASYIDDEAIAMMKQRGTYLVPTLYTTTWFLENLDKGDVPEYSKRKALVVVPNAQKNVAHALASGVKVAMGSDVPVFPHGMNARELGTYVKAGMTPVQAIRTATVNGAELLGLSEHLGSIAPGKWADLIAVDGDPTRDVSVLESVKFVMKAGVVVKNEYRGK